MDDEHEPGKREYINLSALRRFDADIFNCSDLYSLHAAFQKYLSDEFDISDTAVELLYKNNNGVGFAEILPDEDLVTHDIATARDQMRLALMRVALPLAEYLCKTPSSFTDWIVSTGLVAMDVSSGRHKVELCVEPSTTPHELGCQTVRENCPVKVTKAHLTSEALSADMSDLSYLPGLSSDKIERTYAKLSAARRLGLILPGEEDALRSAYATRRAEYLGLLEP